MRAVDITTPGGPDVLRIVERPDPAPKAGEILVAVHAASVNRPDLMQREGRYPPPPGVTDVPGLDLAGVVVALGPADARGEPSSATGRRWRVGDTVAALVAGGGYAELCVVPAEQALPAPHGLSLVEAAAVPETFFTVWTNVFDRGRLQAGEWMLIHGGTSGIGTSAIQLANARGAYVIATAGSGEKCRRAESLGARHCINYREEDFVARVAHLTSGRGVDLVVDMVGGDYTARNLDCLAPDGRLVQISVLGGAVAAVPLYTIMRKRLTVTGSTLRGRAPAEKGAIAAALEREVWPLLESGRVRPVIDRVFPLSEVVAAHRRLESGAVIGKVVLAIADGPGADFFG